MTHLTHHLLIVTSSPTRKSVFLGTSVPAILSLHPSRAPWLGDTEAAVSVSVCICMHTPAVFCCSPGRCPSRHTLLLFLCGDPPTGLGRKAHPAGPLRPHAGAHPALLLRKPSDPPAQCPGLKGCVTVEGSNLTSQPQGLVLFLIVVKKLHNIKFAMSIIFKHSVVSTFILLCSHPCRSFHLTDWKLFVKQLPTSPPCSSR